MQTYSCCMTMATMTQVRDMEIFLSRSWEGVQVSPYSSFCAPRKALLSRSPHKDRGWQGVSCKGYAIRSDNSRYPHTHPCRSRGLLHASHKRSPPYPLGEILAKMPRASLHLKSKVTLHTPERLARLLRVTNHRVEAGQGGIYNLNLKINRWV